MIKAGMSAVEAIAQLTRGFIKIMGRKPDGLEKIKIQQEAIQRLKDLEKVVDMQGRFLDPSKAIMGGTQEGAALRSGIMKATKAKPKPVTSLDDEIKQAYDKAVKEDKFKNVRLRDGRKIESEEDFREYIDELNEDSNFAEGGRIGYKDGPDQPGRRKFMKIMGGLAALPIVGKFFKLGKVATKAAPIVKTPPVAGKPEWFDTLVNKVITEGEDVTKKFATKEREIVHTKKLEEGKFADEVTVYRDLDDGTVRVEYNSVDNMSEAPVNLTFKPGMADEATKGKPADTFQADEIVPESRMVGPDDFEIEGAVDEFDNVVDLNSDVSKLKQFAGKKLTTKEIVEGINKRKRSRAIVEDRSEAADFMTSRQGDYDPSPDDFASGGIATMLGE
tara:strand:- start:1157 stop:2323 length:1167 start_codon:yes stop_codon:yes gene_type:complete